MSNTFATALWAPDALFTLMRAGVDGANLHVRATAINAPFAINAGGLYARPLMYGLLLFIRTLGPEARLIGSHLTAARSLDLSAWAVRVRAQHRARAPDRQGRRTVRVDLHLPATSPATRPAAARAVAVLALGGHAERAATERRRRLGGHALDPDDHARRARRLRDHGAAAQRGAAQRGPAYAGRRGSSTRRASEDHGRVAVAKHPVLAVRPHGSRKHWALDVGTPLGQRVDVVAVA